MDQHGQPVSDWIPKTLPPVSEKEVGVGGRSGEGGLSNVVLLFLLPPPSFAQIPQRVHLVLSVSTDAGLGDTLEQSQGAHVVALGPLEPSARARLVREELALYGKRLEESPFNNQVGCRPKAGGCEDPG